MNTPNAITFKHVSKKFNRGKTFLLKQALLDMLKPSATESFWALQDVSFSVSPGETVGIIGTNGSGKSTILKLIAGVIEPTKGSIGVNGKISPLIELGAGFHPELTGRENVYLNGTILGLSRKDIDQKFDEIVAFSELQDFIDSPVKHYSSGMYMRLGFSVAVYVNPEILLIDEIFAVGDIGFQEKCMRKMKEFKRDKVTIIFISHSLEIVKQFCDRALLVHNGVLVFDGSSKDATMLYRKQIDTKKL